MEILLEKRLPNDVQLLLFDQSRPVAGDRWMVKIVCRLLIPITEKCFAELPNIFKVDEDVIKAELGDHLKLDLVKERTFVDESELSRVKDQLIDDFLVNADRYLSSDIFPEKFLKVKYQKTCERLNQGKTTTEETDIYEDVGPADFSSCFID